MRTAVNPDLLVACLCAEWCGSCRDYRSTFESQATTTPAARFRWVDIEDEAELMGEELDVENFPTLLIAQGDTVLFYGTVLPHAATLDQLVQRAARGELRTAQEPAVTALAARVRAAVTPA